jgi:hypothetical protein
MALNSEQFAEHYKKADKNDKKTIAGERFLRHQAIESPYPEDSEASYSAGWVTSDGYGLENTPMRGIRGVYDPSGRNLEDVATHKEGVAVINQHRSGLHWTQKSR